MKYAIIFLLLLCCIAGWQFGHGTLQYGYLQDTIQAVIERNRLSDENTLRNDLISSAGKNGIQLVAGDIQINIIEADQSGSLVGDIVAQAGITTIQKRIKVIATHKFYILGIIKLQQAISGEKIFTERASAPAPTLPD